MKIVRKTVSAVMLVGLFMITILGFSVQPVKSEPHTYYVDDDGGADFTKIQDAIDAASSGDIIFVYNGTYYENVDVNKTVMLLGESKESTIIDGNGTGSVVSVVANNIDITGVKIQGSDNDTGDSGVHLDSSTGSRISGNIITNNSYGIHLYYSSDNNITSNIITDNEDAISVVSGGSPGSNNVVYNNVTSNVKGITLDCSACNNIERNIISNHTNWGVAIEVTWGGALVLDNSIQYNSIIENKRGIILDNRIISQTKIQFTTVRRNNVTGNQYGIVLRGQYVEKNELYHNNVINNTDAQVCIENSMGNEWDDGYASGGNYWSNYNGTDFYSGSYQNETGWDGIGDSPYVIDENNQDRYPTVKPWPLAHLQVQTFTLGGAEIEDVKVWVDATQSHQLSTAYYLLEHGSHTVEVKSPFYRLDDRKIYKYTFEYWEDDTPDNPRNMTLYKDRIAKAYYRKELWGYIQGHKR